MGVFDRVARPAIMAASRSDRLRHTAERLSVTRNVVHRFVPGETVDDALDSVAQLRDSKRMVSIDYLGEDTTVVEDAEKTVQAYHRRALGQTQRRTPRGLRSRRAAGAPRDQSAMAPRKVYVEPGERGSGWLALSLAPALRLAGRESVAWRNAQHCPATRIT